MNVINEYERWENGRTALMKAATSGHTDTMTDLLNDGIDVNAKIAGGVTALMFAAWSGRLATVRALLAKSADVNARSDAGRTALMCAASNGKADTVKALLDGGRSEERRVGKEC